MRGKVPVDQCNNAATGITPAYAGKRALCFRTLSHMRDHPRVCGEKQPPENVVANKAGITPAYAGKRCTRQISCNSSLGSPPRMRGKAVCPLFPRLMAGITPAYAGKRLKRSHSIGHFSCILRLFHSVLHRASASGGSRAGPCAPPCLPAQNAVPV